MILKTVAWWVFVRLIGVRLSSYHFKLSFLHHNHFSHIGGVLFFLGVEFLHNQTDLAWLNLQYLAGGRDRCDQTLYSISRGAKEPRTKMAVECGRSVQTNIFKTHSEQYWRNCEYIKKWLSKCQNTASSMRSEDCSWKKTPAFITKKSTRFLLISLS